ncbi:MULTISPECIES: hypothetical protein [unclassified Planococcus (in: firmicutes)]|uniref:hypothetical protein n=1 Tax=unclassified Planococcus (in: firmicutes) TaxID=2662419 RepID=UPI000C348D0C|nr:MULTISPECIES: hypothetical protein [unclassified Planococcus (in: firmicutes)]AUD14933.1 hypothetical protein CW734_16230 [Planococcus sp. MB-3u-03]PKG45258.1 hypothetical protein CXF66_15770 [Planococcus sp. Urea-trap-24]PKG87600.1 hypothetical protein CXF91_16620 [Planococcus sp. Urea-3u-39]PKH36736.1 hypothetical protein CXF77_14000 [Planococcus sp. MB-3u-09]
MKSIRVTKYNPKNRDAKGLYTLVDEWTSISDVGKTYHGQIFTMEQYLETEEKYIRAVEVLMQKTRVNHLKLLDLENHSHETALNLSEGKTIPIILIKDLVKMILREEVWARLVAKNQFEIHFGWDYYMYFVGESLTDDIIEELRKIDDLYVEDVQSPHLD